MAWSKRDWQSSIKLLGELAAAPACSNSTNTAANVRIQETTDQLLQDQQAASAHFVPFTQAAWNKLVKKQVGSCSPCSQS
jgi:hypothetical protein